MPVGKAESKRQIPTDHKKEVCPGCGLVLPVVDGGRHPYIGASASCWALFTKVLAREYGDPAYLAIHRTTVDAYAAQHPGLPEPRSITSVNVHLVGLYLVLERRLEPGFVGTVIGDLTKQNADLRWLPPPATLGSVTVIEVSRQDASIRDHEDAVRAWARSVWAAWAPHRETIVVLAEDAVRSRG